MTTAPAARPALRSVSVTLPDGDFAGWSVTMKADFPARLLVTLQKSDDPTEILTAFDSIVMDHNLPSADGSLAASLLDVDPYEGALAVIGAAFEAISKLPPR